jgi:hypothetical protein
MRVLVLILFAVLSGQAYAENNHCTKEEKVVFSCTVGKKVVSVCASQNLSPSEGYMQYRFGKIGSPELLIPQLNEHPLKYVEVDAYQAASGSNGSMMFKNGEFEYTVHWSSYLSDSQTSNGSSIWLSEAGLIVMRKGKSFANFKCNLASGGVLEVDADYLHSTVGFPEQ